MSMAEDLETKQKPARTNATASPLVSNSESTLTPGTAAEQNHGSSQHPLLVSRATIAICKACSTDFGAFSNGWIRITGSYYLSSTRSYQIVGLHRKGKPKPASEGSALVGWYVEASVFSLQFIIIIPYQSSMFKLSRPD